MVDNAASNQVSFNTVRFFVGPWKGRYSSVWRVWSNPGSDDIYLGVSCLLKNLKVSLHQSGKFRAAFVEDYHEKLVNEDTNQYKDRAFMKWENTAVPDGTIMQVLDIHFPLNALSLHDAPVPKTGKQYFCFKPDETALGANDTVTLKIMFHKAHPGSLGIQFAYAKRNFIPIFWVELQNGEYVSFVGSYTTHQPIELNSQEAQNMANSMLQHFKAKGAEVGAIENDLSFQVFEAGLPPSIYNIGNVKIHWEQENKIAVSQGD